MKILICSANDTSLYLFRRELIQDLLKENEVMISAPKGDWVHALEEMGCRFLDTPIDRRGINPVTDLRLFFRNCKLLRQHKPDMVITYTIKPNISGGLACRMLGVPYAVNITGLGTAFQKQGLLRKLVVFLYRVALKKAKVVFFENSTNMELFQEEGIVSPGQSCLLQGAGVNLEHFAYAPYPADEVTSFLFSGRVMREKGIEELFAAMERLRAEGKNCTLDVLGVYEDDYADVIRRCESAGWLRYHGFVADVRPYVEKAHCLVLPSYHEGMANTNLECAAMGRPIITSNIPGCREAVLEGRSGLLCEPQNTDSLYEAMKHFLSMPAEIRAQMGKCGREHMEKVFDRTEVVAQTVQKVIF